jgi:hypothetical protein
MILPLGTFPWLSISVINAKTNLKDLILIILSTYQTWYWSLGGVQSDQLSPVERSDSTFSIPFSYRSFLTQQGVRGFVFLDFLPRGEELMNRVPKHRRGESECIRKKQIQWLLGKMFESRFPHSSGREEG